MVSTNVKYVEELSDKNIIGKNLWIKTNDGDKKDFDRLALSYYQMVNKYINDLLDRSMVSYKVYEKLVNDFISLYKEGYTLDECSGRYSFNPEEGFIIENPEESKYKNDIYCSQFIRNLCTCVFGSGMPEFYVDFNACNFITEKQEKSLMNAAQVVEIKLMYALRLVGFKEELVLEELKINKDKYMKDLCLTKVTDMSNNMSDFYNNVIEADKKHEDAIKLEKRCF